MKVPKEVKIGYKTIKVNMVDGHVIDGNKVCYGNIEYDNGNINISSLYSEDQQKCTFVHECVHGIDDIMETNLSEEQVRKISKGIYSLIKDNPMIFSNAESVGFITDSTLSNISTEQLVQTLNSRGAIRKPIDEYEYTLTINTKNVKP